MFLIRILNISQEGLFLFWYWIFQRRKEYFEERFAVKLRKTFERLGPTFMKLGQMVSLRPDFFPKVYCDELEKCLDKGPILNTELVKKIIEKELKKPIASIFSNFHNKPLAAASLSQVHRAQLHDGTEVIIKLQRPGIKTIIKHDLRIIQIVAFFVKTFYYKRDQIDAKAILNKLNSCLLAELDFRKEVQNMKIISKELTQFDELIIPFVYDSFTTKNLIVMEYIDGHSLRQLIELKRVNKIPSFSFSLGRKLVKVTHMLLTMSMENGHFHADLHPANIIITKEGKIGLIDFGSIDYFDRNARHDILIFFLGIVFTEPNYLIKSIKAFSKKIRPSDEKLFFRDINELCDRHRNAKTHEMSLSQLLIEGIEIAFKYGYSVPWSVLLFSRTSMNVDGTLLKLAPDYVASKEITKHLLNIYAKSRYKQITSLPSLLDHFEILYQVSKKTPNMLINSVNILSNFLEQYKNNK